MSDTLPPRLLEGDAELTPEERRALVAGRRSDARSEAGAREQAKRSVWGALVLKLPEGAAGAAATGTSAAATATGLTFGALLKPLGIGLLLGATTAGGVALTRATRVSTTAPASSVSAAKLSPGAAEETRGNASRPNSADRAGEPAKESAATASSGPPRRDAPSVAGTKAQVEVLAENPSGDVALPSEASFTSEPAPGREHDLTEGRRVADARALLRAGNARGASVALEAIRRDFPRGSLAQEREALAVEALAALGQRSEARRRASEFLRQYPESPHAKVVRGFLE